MLGVVLAFGSQVISMAYALVYTPLLLCCLTESNWQQASETVLTCRKTALTHLQDCCQQLTHIYETQISLKAYQEA